MYIFFGFFLWKNVFLIFIRFFLFFWRNISSKRYLLQNGEKIIMKVLTLNFLDQYSICIICKVFRAISFHLM